MGALSRVIRWREPPPGSHLRCDPTSPASGRGAANLPPDQFDLTSFCFTHSREPGIDGHQHRENQLAGLPLAGVVPRKRFAGRSDRRPDAGGDRDPRTDGDRAPWRLLAADRLFCLHRGIAGLCRPRQQPLPVLRRRFHHHADFRRRTCADGRRRLTRLSGARDGAGAPGRRDPRHRQPVPPRLDRQSACRRR